MAHILKFKKQAISSLFRHNNRTTGENVVHSNETIDSTRTMQNYFLKKGSAKSLDKRLDEVFHLGSASEIVMCEVCITLPKDVSPNDELAFFCSVYDFYCNDFGEQNIINAVIHKDETTPHLHLDIVPIVTGEVEYDSRGKRQLAKWKEQHADRLAELMDEYGRPVVERLCCKELINREYLRSMHTRLSDFIKHELGYECSVLNGATAHGNRSVQQIKADSLKSQVEQLERQKGFLEQETKIILSVARQNGLGSADIGLLPLIEKISDLENQNRVYRTIISSQRYPYKKSELEQLKSKRYFPAQSAKVNVFDGRLTDAEIPDNGLVLIEIYDKVIRPLPQQHYIDSDDDLRNQTQFALRMNNGSSFFIRSSKTSGKSFLFIRTDTVQQTILALLEMERVLKEQEELWRERRLFMERISNDEYDLARLILNKTNYETVLFTGREISDREDKQISMQKT